MQKKAISEINIIKLIAAMLIVFVHCEFPGNFGKCVMNVAQFAVPFFFMLSGYFTEISGPLSLFLKRTKKLAIIFLISSVGYLIFGYICGSNDLELISSVRGMCKFVLLNDTNFIKYHLWFLPALIYTYFFVYIFYKFLGNKIYYLILMLILFWPLGYGIFRSITGITIPYILYRNFFFEGIPYFLLGNIIRKKEKTVCSILHFSYLFVALISSVVIEICLTVFDTGFTDFGFMLIAVSVFLICVYFKRNPGKVKTRFVSDMSLFVYLIHPLFIGIVSLAIPSLNVWVKPFLVVFLSILSALLYAVGCYWVKKRNYGKKL